MKTTQPSENQLARLEALLFVHGEPLMFKKISAMMGVPEPEARLLVAVLRARLLEPERGLALVVDDARVQLVTKSAFGRILEEFVKEELSEDLSPASVETLSLVAYFGPISRARIDYHRGVNSTFILRSLLLRGLVERVSDPARPTSYLYRPSVELLKHLGLSSREELPEFEKYSALLSRFEGGAGGGEAQTVSGEPVSLA